MCYSVVCSYSMGVLPPSLTNTTMLKITEVNLVGCQVKGGGGGGKIK